MATPRSFSLAELKQLPSRTQITRHTCEEGWTAIGQWTGVPLARVLDAAGILPTARFVVFYSLRRLGRQHRHARRPAPADDPRLRHERRAICRIAHGAPVRLRVERQMGYKSMKYLQPHRRRRRVRRRRQEGQHPERLGLVHGDLNRRSEAC